MNNRDRIRNSSPSLFIRLLLSLILMLLITGFTPLRNPARAGSGANPKEREPVPTTSLPRLDEFREQLRNGLANQVVGVYVPGIMAFPVVQQPTNNPGYVAGRADVLTQFSLAASYKTIGLLAHNYLAGEAFFQLQPSQEVHLVFGDGSLSTYIVDNIAILQALQPDSPYSSFKEVNQPGKTLSVADAFLRIYGPGDRLVFQTCVEANGVKSWGRLFVTALPLEAKLQSLDMFRMKKFILQ